MSRLSPPYSALLAALVLASCNRAAPAAEPTLRPPPPTWSPTEWAEDIARGPKVPTSTATPVPPTSAVPTATPTPIPTLESLPPSVLNTYDSAPSPDGRWLVRHLVHDARVGVLREYGEHGYYYNSQSLVAADGAITRTIRTDWITGDIGDTLPQFLGWAPDSAAAFVYMARHGDGCVLSGSSDDVWRVSVPDGEVTVLGAVPGSPSLSADARWIGGVGYVDETTAEFAWINVTTGATGRDTFPIPLADDGTAGWVVDPRWSPDGSAMVARVAYDACSDDWREALVYHELGTADSRVILETKDVDSGFLWIDDWLPDDTLVVTDRPSWWGASDVEPRVWRIDARTGAER